MRTKEELDEAYRRVGELLNQEEYEDDEALQAIHDTLRWFDGYDWDNTIGMYLPS